MKEETEQKAKIVFRSGANWKPEITKPKSPK